MPITSQLSSRSSTHQSSETTTTLEGAFRMPERPALIDMPTHDLIDAIRHESEQVQQSYTSMAAELERRTNQLLTRSLVFATVVNSILTGVLALVALVGLIRGF